MIQMTKQDGCDVAYGLSTDNKDDALAMWDGVDPLKFVYVEDGSSVMWSGSQWKEQGGKLPYSYQTKTVTPGITEQTVTASAGYKALGTVKVKGVPVYTGEVTV